MTALMLAWMVRLSRCTVASAVPRAWLARVTSWAAHWRRARTVSARRSRSRSRRSTGRVGMVAMNWAITAASIRSFFARRPFASAKARTRRGLSRWTLKPWSCSTWATPASKPPEASRPMRAAPIVRQYCASSAQPCGVLSRASRAPSGKTATSSRAWETSIPTCGAICAIFGSLPCWFGVLPRATVRAWKTSRPIPCCPATLGDQG